MTGERALVLLREGSASGQANMRRDLELLHACADGLIGGAVRLYSFSPPCLTLGSTQPMSHVDTAACARDGVDIVRRPSGGRAVLHDQEVTYAVVCHTADSSFGGSVLTSCARIHQAVALGLGRLGLQARPHGWEGDFAARARRAAALADCFATPAAHELVDGHGRKLVGSAQHRYGNALLQHGSIPLDAPVAGRYLLESAGFERSSVRTVLGRQVTAAEVEAALIDGFHRVLGARLQAAARQPEAAPDHALDTTS